MRKVKPPKMLYINVLTLITVVIWVITSLVRVLIAKPEYDVPEEILTPISPTLDINTLSEVERRLYFQENEIPEALFVPIPVENE